MTSPQPGSEIDGFCLGEMLHAGSMAYIYRLNGPRGPLPLVMKIPRLGPGERAVNVIGFEVCRMVLGALGQGAHHPTLIAYGDVETTPYLVMSFVEGARLSDWLPRAPLAAGELARLGAAFALALHALHSKDVVHLDLKPTNVIYRPDSEAVIIDFGLARHSHYPDLLAEELRFPVGNWEYMSPEQILGVRCDPRSDIYAFGGILYELATGRLPFGHPHSVAKLRRRLYRDPVPHAQSLSKRRSGCRRSSCVVWSPMRASVMPRPNRLRSTCRIRTGSSSPSGVRGGAGLAGERWRGDGCRRDGSNRRHARLLRP